MSLQDTLGNKEWLRANEDAIKKLLPDKWTDITQLQGVRIGSKLKELGVEYNSEEQFARIMIFMEKIGIVQAKGNRVRNNPDSIFKK